MVEIPINVKIANLRPFWVCKFRDVNHEQGSFPHYYVVLPINDDGLIMLVIVKSYKKDKVEIFSRSCPSLLEVNSDDIGCLDRLSTIDCDRPMVLPKRELQNQIDPTYGLEIIQTTVSEDCQKQIIGAIKSSPIVKPAHKGMLSV